MIDWHERARTDRDEIARLRAANADLAKSVRELTIIVDAQDKMLSAYRVGGRPSEKTLDALGYRDEILRRARAALTAAAEATAAPAVLSQEMAPPAPPARPAPVPPG